MNNKKLYILSYDHGGYVLWKDAVKPRLKELFEWMEKYPKLRIGLDYESFTFDEFSKFDPEVVELAQKLIEKYPDRVGLGATTYGQPLSLTISEESNARQLIYAIRTNLKYFGKTPDVYAISEFALNNQTPQLISQCGYKAAILRAHVMGYGYVRTFDSAWGNWVGKDNTSIPAVPTYNKQGRGYNCTTVDNWILSRWPQDTEISLEDFEKMFSKHTPLLASRYDDLTQEIKGVTEHIETKDNYEYVLLEDIPELYGEATDILKTTDNDFCVQMPWGYCGNEIFNGVRASEVNAVQAEKLDAIAFALGAEPETEKLTEAWQYALAAQHHDVTICGLYEYSRRFIPTSLKASDFVKSKSLKTIKSSFDKDGKKKILAINSHSFPIDEWVKTKNGYAHIQLPAFTVKTVDENKENFSYLWNEEKGILTTPVYTLKLTENGIEYITENATDRKIADNGSDALFTAFVNNEDCISVGKWTVNTDISGAAAVYSGNIGAVEFTLEMRLSGNSPRIDCKTAFTVRDCDRVGRIGEKMGLNKALTVNGHRHEDKLSLNLNLCLDENRRMFRDLPYSIADWNGAIRTTEDYWYELDKIIIDTEVSPEESFRNTTYINGIYWVAMSDKNNGFAVMNRGCMGAYIKGNRLSVPLMYSNEYLCGEKILDGTYENEFALLPFDAGISDAELHRKAVSYTYQPVVTTVNYNEEISCAFADFRTENGEVILTSFYHENGDILARFCNYSDTNATAVLTPSKGILTAETDLLGNDTKTVCDGTLSFRPWEIKTARIKL